jgi:hypothetical protein
MSVASSSFHPMNKESIKVYTYTVPLIKKNDKFEINYELITNVKHYIMDELRRFLLLYNNTKMILEEYGLDDT